MARRQTLEDYLCDVLLEMIEEQPFATIKVTDFVKRAAISRSSFYTHFDSIYDVLQMIEDKFIDGLPHDTPEISHRNPITLTKENALNGTSLTTTANYCIANKRTIMILTGPNGDPSFDSKIVRRVKQYVISVYNSPNVHLRASSIQGRAVAEYIATGIWNTIKWMLRHDDEVDIEEFTSIIFALITQDINVKI